MHNLKYILLIVAAPSLAAVSAGAADAATEGKKCTVSVNRSQENNGVYDLTRQEFEDGSCVCYVYTGVAPQSTTIENSINALRQSQTCPNAKVMALKGSPGATPGNSAIGLAGLMIPAAAAVVGTASGNDNPVSP